MDIKEANLMQFEFDTSLNRKHDFDFFSSDYNGDDKVKPPIDTRGLCIMQYEAFHGGDEVQHRAMNFLQLQFPGS